MEMTLHDFRRQVRRSCVLSTFVSGTLTLDVLSQNPAAMLCEVRIHGAATWRRFLQGIAPLSSSS